MRFRQWAVVCAAALVLCLSFAASAQPTLPSAYFLGTEDRNNDGVSDLKDGLNLYRIVGGKATQINQTSENVRNALPDFATGRVAYIAQDTIAAPTLTLVGADGKQTSIELKGLANAALQYFGKTLWLTAQDDKSQFYIIGEDATLKETGRVEVNLTSPTFGFDVSGQWASAYDPNQRRLLLYHLPDLTLTDLSIDTPWGAPAWGPQSSRFAVPTGDANNPHGLTLVEPPNKTTAGADLELPADTVKAVQIQWSPSEKYLSYRSLPGASLTAELPLKLVNTGDETLETFSQKDAQLRVVTWSSDDRYALVSAASSPLADQISVNYRIFDPQKREFVAGDPVNTFVTPVAFAWQPNKHILAILGTSLIDSKPGIFTFNVETGAISTLYNSSDENLLKSNLFWSSDGASIFFTAASTDVLSQLTGVTNALLSLDVASGKASVVSPDDVSVLSYGIQVR
jgi:hypothetical protein